MSFDFGIFYLKRKQYLEELKKSKQNSNEIVKRTLEIIISETESGMSDLIESPFCSVSEMIQEQGEEERFKSFLEKYYEEKKKKE